jgi:shikimate dehydrogenase
MVPRRAAVLGSPIAHSRSPVLHRAAYAALGLDWTYDAIEVAPRDLPEFLGGCSWPHWAGLSLTMPLKTDVLPLLDEVSALAAQTRAANTVVFTEGGTTGDNTDVAGMRRALEVAHGSPLDVSRAVIIGAGATARSALVALAGLGAREIRVIARRHDRAEEIVELGQQLDVSCAWVPWEDESSLSADAVIATVPPGVADAFAQRTPELPGVLLDVAYGRGPTALASAWSSAGGSVADGLDLLLWQAVDQVRLMTGLDAPVDAMRAALERNPGQST